MQFFEAADGRSFREAFETATGLPLSDLIGEFVDPGQVSAVVLGGSIPLGIAAATSDVDLLVLLEKETEVRLSDERYGPVLFAGRFVGAEELVVATAVVRHRDVEVDLQFLSAPRLEQFLALLKKARVTITLQQRQLVGRLRTGWLLDREDWPHSARGLTDGAFDLHCATQSLINARRWLIDADVAARENWMLALNLGQRSVEKIFEAYFSSRGYSALGVKWLRFLDRNFDRMTGGERGAMRPALARTGMALLFPVASPSGVAAYLAEVGSFVDAVQRTMAETMRYKLAFDLSPHVARPRTVMQPRPQS